MTPKTTKPVRKSAPRKVPAKKAAPRRAAANKVTDTITVSVTDFTRALARVKPFACTDQTLPMINGVALQLRDRVLTVTATDRFTLGSSIVRPVFVDGNNVLPPDFEVLIRLMEMPILLTALKRSETKAINRIDLRVADGRIELDGVRVGDPDIPGRFPEWRGIIAEAEQRVADGTPDFTEIVVNPSYLRRFALINPTPKMIVSGQSKPVVAVADDFVGVLMPVATSKARAEVLSEFGIGSSESAA